MAIIRESNVELAHQYLAKANGHTDLAASTYLLATAHVYATLAVADALAIVHREIAYVGNAIAEDQTP